MTTFKNTQQVQLLALSRSQGSSGSNNLPAYRYIRFLDVHNKKVTLFIESKLTVSLWKLKGFLVDHGFPPEEVDLHGNKIQKILMGRRVRTFDFVIKPGYVGGVYMNGDGSVVRAKGGKARREPKTSIGPFLYPKANFQKPSQCQSGTLDGWKKFVASKAKYSPPLMLSLCAALSGYTLHFSEVESGGFHLYGDSSIGKSTCLKLAASVCGDPESVNSWSTTETAFEEMAAGHNDSLMILDELNLLEKDPKIAAQKAMKLVYGGTSGQGKKRSRAYDDGSISWVVALLSSGESSLNEYASMGGREQMAGEVVRLVDVPADMENGFGIYENLPSKCEGSSADMAERTNRDCNEHYGTAKDAFIGYLLTRLSTKGGARKLEGDISKYMNGFLAEHSTDGLNGQRLRIAKRFALAYSAGALAVDAEVLPFTQDKVMHGISTCFKKVIENQPLSLGQLVALARKKVDRALLKALKSSLSYEELSSTEEAELPIFYRTCIKKKEVLALKPKSLQKFVRDDKVCKALLKEYAEEGVLLRSADGQDTRPPPSGKSGFRLSRRYCFLIDELKK